jgi:hypothetical protein
MFVICVEADLKQCLLNRLSALLRGGAQMVPKIKG